MLEKLTFVLPNEDDPYTFHMNYAYDSWNRMLSMSYPDGEEVNYAYDVGGNLRSVTGTNGWQTHNYITNISYDKFGNRTRVDYGNGVYTNYSYDVIQRLSAMNTYDPYERAYLQQLSYTYDNVNNVTKLSNSTGKIRGDMGGKYEHKYSYDQLYRLQEYNSVCSESPHLNSTLWMIYSPGGRIMDKSQTYYRSGYYGEGKIESNKTYYYYDNTSNKLNSVYDYTSRSEDDFFWDANGNMEWQCHFGDCTSHTWDDENRMIASGSELYSGFYFYNSEGDRTYKFSGEKNSMNINGRPQTYSQMNSSTLYVSPYLVASDRGCSKHIYAGTERVASHLLNGSIDGIRDHVRFKNEEEIDQKLWDQRNMITDIHEINYSQEGLNISLNHLNYLYTNTRSMPNEDIYYYHTDHLGSSSWITYTDGSPVQYMSYMPFGELQIDQRSGDWNSRYTFSGKERDEETGYSYFGARYYDPDISIWLSRDPLAHLYPHQSPYVYCSNNPVKRIDPNGMADGNFYDNDGFNLGNDGVVDGKIYVVTDDNDKNKILANRAVGKTTSASEVNSAMELPSQDIRNEMVDGLREADAANPNAEHGGLYGRDGSSKSPDISSWPEGIRWAEEGPTGNPCLPDASLQINYNTADNNWFSTQGTFHCHPSGNACGGWDQNLSPADRNNAVKNFNSGLAKGTNMVFGMRDNNVRLYNGRGNATTMSINNFLKIK